MLSVNTLQQASDSSHAHATQLPGHRPHCSCHPVAHRGSKDHLHLDPTQLWQNIRHGASEESTCRDCIALRKTNDTMKVSASLQYITFHQMATNQHKIPKFSTMAGKEDPHLDTFSQPVEQCAPLQEKTMNIASQQLINILVGKINTARKQLTIARPHPTCSHKASAPHTCQISHLSNKPSRSHTVFNLPADIASGGHTAFHTMLQMVRKHGCKPIPVNIDSRAEINMVPLSKC